MRNLFFLILTLLVVSCSQSDNKEKGKITTDMVSIPGSASGSENSDELPVFEAAEENFDFGKISQGQKVVHVFKFKNTGKSDMLISNARASCGCTVADYPKDPIKPGSDGSIKVEFNSEGKSGKVAKTVTVITNCNPNTKVLTFTADIVVPESK